MLLYYLSKWQQCNSGNVKSCMHNNNVRFQERWNEPRFDSVDLTAVIYDISIDEISKKNLKWTRAILPLGFLVLIGDLYSPDEVNEDVILGNLMSRCDPFAVTILLFIAYSFVVISLAIKVVRTVPMYVSLTKRYSKAVRCQ